MKTRIPQEIKDQVISRIKEGKETVAEIARQHALNVNTVYGWITHGIGVNNPLIEINYLKRENTKLKEIIGNLILTTERGKKN